jgi:hypothetical protein
LKKIIVAVLAAAALSLSACGSPQATNYNDQYCDGNVYTAVDEDDYTCSPNGVVNFHGDHEDDHKKKKVSHGVTGPAGSYAKPSPKPSKSGIKGWINTQKSKITNKSSSSTRSSGGWGSSSKSSSSSRKK